MRKAFHLICLLSLFPLCMHAQWAVGMSGGLNYNTPSVSKGYATDMTFEGSNGFNVGIIGRYQFIDWLAVRADLRLNTRNYKMQRHYYLIKDIYTKHRDTYMHLPVTADLSFGGQKLRGHVYLGGYVGYWLNAHRNGNAIQESTEGVGIVYQSFDEDMNFDSNRDNRFNAGAIGGLGLSYLLTKHWEVMAEWLYFYDLTKSNKTYSVSNPRYNSTSDFNIGIMYNF